MYMHIACLQCCSFLAKVVVKDIVGLECHSCKLQIEIQNLQKQDISLAKGMPWQIVC